jgi:hypothetical protein
MANIEMIKIHPSIGIARLGNSPDNFFIGPEIPGAEIAPKGGYKDSQMRIKRQAARFRIFGYDKKGNLVKEITANDAAITWSVHLANKKAAWKKFNGLKENLGWRNPTVKDRNSLMIDAGIRTLSLINSKALFDTGKFKNTIVQLGEMQMDKDGRLLILGGFGKSAGSSKIAGEFANNDDWYDDISDGPVTASIKLNGSSKSMIASPAWVLCPPPDFAPAITNVVTLYDTLLQVAIEKLNIKLPSVPSYTKDIYPILTNAGNVKWVSMMLWQMHAMGHTNHLKNESKHTSLDNFIKHPITNTNVSQTIFDKLTDPHHPLDGDDNDMPMLWSDYYDKKKRKNGKFRNFTLCKWQYDYLKKWKNGDFKNDWIGEPLPEKIITPEGLDKAALQNCIGGPFFPGIEASWYIRDKYKYIEPFRLSHSTISAGDVTKQMALPWQADFFYCSQNRELAWWPAQRPDDVFIEADDRMHAWSRGYVKNPNEMVKKWFKLGYVTKKGNRYIETERDH